MGLSRRNRFLKRCLDLTVAVSLSVLLWWLVGLLLIAASIDTKRFGLFSQPRVGRDGRLFRIYKIRTMRDDADIYTTVTSSRDPRITRFGGLLRRTKLDELPQIYNVLRGHMSLVGPRPDVAGFADRLKGSDRIILSVRPGVTGPATLACRDEEILLAQQEDPEAFNREVLFPQKVAINRRYVEEYTLSKDLIYIFRTVTLWFGS